MSENPPPTVNEGRYARRHGRTPAGGTRTPSSLRGLHLRISVIPAAVMALLASATVASLLIAPPSDTVIVSVLAGAAVAAVLTLVAAAYGAGRATRRMHQRVDALRSSTARGQENLRQLVGRVLRGERFSPHTMANRATDSSDPFVLLAHDLHQDQLAAQNAVVHIANLKPGDAAQQQPEKQPEKQPGQQVEVFVNVARRMQSLVHREIGLLDELESQVEDPDLLKGLFTIDHLATRMRRQSESLAVLGGAASRRQWSRPVTLYEVLRSAVAEVEHYARVKVVPPIKGTLKGGAVVDVIHLVAELIENATKFSSPRTQVMLRAEEVTAGIAVEVEDRGLGMPSADQHGMNNLLADPDQVNLEELLRDGRIGLFVVSTLARKHGVKVQLQSNVYGGVQAVVVLPHGLVGSDSQEQADSSQAQPASREPTRAVAGATQTHTSSPTAAPPPPPTAAPPSPAQTPAGTGYAQNPTTGGQRPTLPVREAGMQANAQEPNDRPNQRPAGPAPATEPDRPPRPDNNERPPLPQRRAQSHMAPQLRDAPSSQQDEPTSTDHSPGLMAAFQGGISRAERENENSPADHTGSTS